MRRVAPLGTEGRRTDRGNTMTEQSTNNRVQLGCGTLIIIAIIVLLFSGGSDSRKLRGELEDLNRRLDRMERKLDELG